MTSRDTALILKSFQYRSPNFFFGIWEFTWGYSIWDEKTKSFIQDKKEKINCKYKSLKEVKEVLKKQYDFIKKTNSSRVIYPDFEDCLRISRFLPEGRGGTNIKAIYLNMMPAKLL